MLEDSTEMLLKDSIAIQLARIMKPL